MATSASSVQAEPVQLIPLDQLRPSPYNPRVFGEKPSESLVELARSIRSLSQIQPAIGRPLDGNGTFEIVAGERRFRACMLRLEDGEPAAPHLRAVVRELTDEQAQEITVTENLDREDLTPIEEANGVHTLLELYRGDVEAVASRLGRPVSWVAARARLTTLSKAWREALADEEGDLQTWTAGHLAEVSKLEPAAQDELLESLRWHYKAMTIDLLRRRVANLSRTIGSAPFDVEDAALVPKVGACSTCPTTSASTPGLFADEGDDIRPGELRLARCLNSTCWNAKAIAAARAKLAELRAEGAEAVIVFDRYEESRELPEELQETARQASSWKYQKAKAKEKGAWAGVYAVGERAGKVQWFRTSKDAQRFGTSSAPKPKSERTAAEVLADREEALERRRVAHVAAAVSEALQGSPPPASGVLLVLAAALGTKRNRAELLGGHSYGGSILSESWGQYRNAWTDIDNLTEGGTNETRAALWSFGIVPVLQTRLQYQSHVDAKKLAEECRRVCELAKLDHEALRAAAEQEIPEPKSWAKLREEVKAEKAAKRKRKRKAKKQAAQAEASA